MINILEKIWSFITSIKLAVVVIAGMAVSMTIATIIESRYDTPTAQYYVYQSKWFYAIMVLLGINILAVAISRYPWKKRHTPFLMAHAGILMILIGSYLTAVSGLDGNMRLSEGEVSSAVELNDHVLVYNENETTLVESLPWMPRGPAESFSGKEFPKLKIKIEKYLSNANQKINFVPIAKVSTENAEKKEPKFKKTGDAIFIRILGAPMGGSPEFWLYTADPAWSSQKMGLARFLIRDESKTDLAQSLPSTNEDSQNEARLDFVISKKGELRFESTSVRGEKLQGKIDLEKVATAKKDEPYLVDPKWRMPIKIQVKKFVRNAELKIDYEDAFAKPGLGMGAGIQSPAILVSLINNPASKLWLGIGDRADFTDENGKSVAIGYYPRRVVLPFALRLEKFEMKHNPGTMDPSAYSSYVQVIDQFQKTEKDMGLIPTAHITMNEPLKQKMYTFYQASYIPDFPRPTVTVLSVNHDPGRFLKYSGSILLVLGAIALYLSKLKKKTI